MGPKYPFKNIAIVGLGVMGGSLLLALRKDGYDGNVFVHSRSETSKAWGRKSGATLVVDSIEDFPREVDLVVLAVPSITLPKMAEALEKHPSNPLITDLASTKGDVIPLVQNMLQTKAYLSCHPMCGSEKIGSDGARADLYEGKAVILTAHDDRSQDQVSSLKRFWESLGSKVYELDPKVHDESVAWVSHMPHLLIAALVKAIQKGEIENKDLFQVAGTGLKSVSRLAASNPSLWKNIVMENKDAVLKAWRGMKEEMDELERILISMERDRGEELETYFQVAKDIHFKRGLQS